METLFFSVFNTLNPLQDPAFLAGTSLFAVVLPLTRLKRKHTGKKSTGTQPTLTLPKEDEEVDLWDFQSKQKYKSLKDSKNSEGQPRMESIADDIQADRTDTFLDSVWQMLRNDLNSRVYPVRTLSKALHKETHALNNTLREKNNWELADKECLKKTTASTVNDLGARCRNVFFLCPPQEHIEQLVVHQDPWFLAETLLGNMEQEKSVATTLKMDERLGHLIFGSLGLSLIRIIRPVPASQAPANDILPLSGITPEEIRSWPIRRNEAFARVFDYQFRHQQGISSHIHQAMLDVMQKPEAIWELNQRGGRLVEDFKNRIQALYEQTDREVIHQLAKDHGVSENEIRFSSPGDPFKTFQMAVGRHISYQIRAKPGETIYEFDESRPGSFRLREAEPGETAWIDLPSEQIKPIYEAVFFTVADAFELTPPQTPAAFSKSMRQIFGARLPAELFGKTSK